MDAVLPYGVACVVAAEDRGGMPCGVSSSTMTPVSRARATSLYGRSCHDVDSRPNGRGYQYLPGLATRLGHEKTCSIFPSRAGVVPVDFLKQASCQPPTSPEIQSIASGTLQTGSLRGKYIPNLACVVGQAYSQALGMFITMAVDLPGIAAAVDPISGSGNTCAPDFLLAPAAGAPTAQQIKSLVMPLLLSQELNGERKRDLAHIIGPGKGRWLATVHYRSPGRCRYCGSRLCDLGTRANDRHRPDGRRASAAGARRGKAAPVRRSRSGTGRYAGREGRPGPGHPGGPGAGDPRHRLYPCGHRRTGATLLSAGAAAPGSARLVGGWRRIGRG